MTTSLYEMYETNIDRETSGITLDFGDAGKIQVARAGATNKAFAQMLEAKTRPHRRQMDTDTMPYGVADRIMREVFAETVVLGWSGIHGKDGEVIEYSVEACIKLFEDLPDWFTQVREEAAKFSNFRAAGIEADAGN